MKRPLRSALGRDLTRESSAGQAGRAPSACARPYRSHRHARRDRQSIGAATGTATAADTTTASAEPVVISPGARFVPRATVVLNTGETGFLTAQEGDDRLRWIDYATGATTVLDHRLPKPLAYDVDDLRFAEHPGSSATAPTPSPSTRRPRPRT